MTLTLMTRHELQRAFARRYRRADKHQKTLLLDEFCQLTGYHRKYAVALLRSGPLPLHKPPSPPRGAVYGPATEKALVRIWEAADYPWSMRLRAILPLWLPWAAQHFKIAPEVEEQLRTMSPRTMDRLLRAHKAEIRGRRFGRTKPGTLLKHHIPIRTDAWDISEPGFVEVDSVAHCGENAYGDFANSINLTDIHTTWTDWMQRLERALSARELSFEMLGIQPYPIDVQKGVDVLLALDLVHVAQKHPLSTLVLVSGDRDLLEAVRRAQDEGASGRQRGADGL